jgi:hypothetical protein
VSRKWLALLAEACLDTGRVEEGLLAVGEALAVTEQTAALYREAELEVGPPPRAPFVPPLSKRLRGRAFGADR